MARIFGKQELDATERLKAIWNSKKGELGLTQEKAAQACGWSNQSAFGAYLNGRVPLNTEAVLRLAIALQVHPTEIMPELSELLPDQGNIKGSDSGDGNEAPMLTDEAIAFAASWQALDDTQKQALVATLNAFKHQS